MKSRAREKAESLEDLVHEEDFRVCREADKDVPGVEVERTAKRLEAMEENMREVREFMQKLEQQKKLMAALESEIDDVAAEILDRSDVSHKKGEETPSPSSRSPELLVE